MVTLRILWDFEFLVLPETKFCIAQHFERNIDIIKFTVGDYSTSFVL